MTSIPYSVSRLVRAASTYSDHCMDPRFLARIAGTVLLVAAAAECTMAHQPALLSTALMCFSSAVTATVGLLALGAPEKWIVLGIDRTDIMFWAAMALWLCVALVAMFASRYGT